MCKKGLIFVAVLFAFSFLASDLLRADVNFTDANGTHLWTDNGNWLEGTAAVAGDYAYFNEDFNSTGNYCLIQAGDNITCARLRMSAVAAGKNVYIKMEGGTLNVTTGIDLGYYHFYDDSFDACIFEQDGGDVICGDFWRVGYRTGVSRWILKGGTVYCGRFLYQASEPENYSKVEIGGGSFSVKYDRVSEMEGLFGTTLLPYNGVGTLVAEFDPNWTEFGRTIVYNSAYTAKTGVPSPTDGASNIEINTQLSWSPGAGAIYHDVYFGTVFEDVNQADDPNVVPGQGRQTSITFNPGTLSYDTTYYWRIDEVTSGGVIKGDVWSFTTTLGVPSLIDPLSLSAFASTSYNETRAPIYAVNGAGLVGDSHLSSYPTEKAWQALNVAEFPKWFKVDLGVNYYLDSMKIWNFNWAGYTDRGAKNFDIYYSSSSSDPGNPIDNPGNWTFLKNRTLTEAPGNDSYNTPDEFDMEMVDAHWVALNLQNHYGQGYGGLSEVQFFGIQSDFACNPAPEDGYTSADVDNLQLSWTAGAGAASHDIYVGTDYNSVYNATNPNVLPGMGNQTGVTFNLSGLEYSTTYYWRVDERNGGLVKIGDVWQFTTTDPPISTPPGKPALIYPTGEETTSTYTTLSWSTGENASYGYLYLGTDYNDVNDATNPYVYPGKGYISAATTEYEPTNLQYGMKYYWRLDQINSIGTTKGDVWSFETCPEPVVRTAYYVATDGNDNNTGGKDDPFATIQKARDAVRHCISVDPQQDRYVWLREGDYSLDETLCLTSIDSPASGCKVTYAGYPGEEVILNSCAPITSWQQVAVIDEPADLPAAASGHLWVADVPAEYGLFKALYQGETELPRARGAGFKPVITTRLDPRASKSRLYYPAGAIKNWPNLSDIEILIRPDVPYEMNILPIASVDEVNRIATSAVESSSYLVRLRQVDEPDPDASVWIENIIEGLNEPGEWVLNTLTGKLYLWSPDDNMPTDIKAPLFTCLIRVEGLGQTASNINFRNLKFTRSDRADLAPGDINQNVQHSWQIYDKDEAMLRFRGAENCQVKNCKFVNSPATAIRLDQYCQNIKIENCDFEYLGGSGVFFCGPMEGATNNKLNEVFNCIFHDCGQKNWAYQGITIFQSASNRIAHNLIHDMPYSGISITGDSDEALTTSANNIIEYTEVYKTCKMLGDGNGIYLRRCANGNIVRRNYIHHIMDPGSHGGLRFDDFQAGQHAYENIFYKCAYTGIIFKALNWVDNNIFIDMLQPGDPNFTWNTDCRGYILLRPSVDNYANNSSMQRNIFYNSEDYVDFYEDDYHPYSDLADCIVNNNIYYHSQNASWGSNYLSQMKALGLDSASLSTDPLFVDYANQNFNLQPNSPAITQLGFNPINFDIIGPLPTSDFNGDGKVDFLDLAILASHWGSNEPSVDIAPEGGDGVIDIEDLSLFAANWLE